jgi:hypothetical protein
MRMEHLHLRIEKKGEIHFSMARAVIMASQLAMIMFEMMLEVKQEKFAGLSHGSYNLVMVTEVTIVKVVERSGRYSVG